MKEGLSPDAGRPGVGEAPTSPEPADVVDRDAARLRRLRWRARRGLLENDIVLARFLDARASSGLSDDEIFGLDVLLDLTDSELLDLVLGRAEPQGEADCPAARAVLASLRAV